MLEILYYPEGSKGPVKDYLETLVQDHPKAFARLALDLEVLGAEGLRSQLHSLEKKSAKAPYADLALARRRLKEVMTR